MDSIKVVLKGVLRADDAERAVACGVAGIVVSNLGGRSLDHAPATVMRTFFLMIEKIIVRSKHWLRCVPL